MSVITRFAPSPTGFLHIGGARTALFNWLYARHHGGQFLLRIEDTDRARSTEAAIQAIFDGLDWLELHSDAEPVFQFSRAERHAEVARAMLEAGHAYHCYASQEELDAMREAQRAAGLPVRYDGRWRERDASDAPADVPPVIRLKAPRTGETIVRDQVQGDVRFANDQLDDLVLLRADGTPTYMLSVVVDDHDMGVTHIIRGDDHLTNAGRQSLIYQALGWDVPVFAHIPLIHGPDGKKLSKRHGALGVDAYRDMGFLPEAMRNYLLRLGWGHGDDEIISTQQAIEWFDLSGVGRGAARFDLVKLTSLNAHYLRQSDDADLVKMVAPFLAARGAVVDETGQDRLHKGMSGLKLRAETLIDLADSALFYVAKRPLPITTAKADKLLDANGMAYLQDLRAVFAELGTWDAATLEDTLRREAEARGVGLGKLAQPLRVALSGSHMSPGVFEVAEVLGRTETLGRIDDAIAGVNARSYDAVQP